MKTLYVPDTLLKGLFTLKITNGFFRCWIWEPSGPTVPPATWQKWMEPGFLCSDFQSRPLSFTSRCCNVLLEWWSWIGCFKNFLSQHLKCVPLFISWWIFCTVYSYQFAMPLWMKCLPPGLCSLSGLRSTTTCHLLTLVFSL